MNTRVCESRATVSIHLGFSESASSDKQHLTQRLGVGGLYAATEQVRAALAPAPGVQRAILDLGKSIVSLRVHALTLSRRLWYRKLVRIVEI